MVEKGAAFTEETKQKALIRDKYHCQCCGVLLMQGGRYGTGKPYEIHHKKPKAQGGTNSLGNAISLCTGCHTQIHEVQKMGYTFNKARDIVQTAKRYKTTPAAVIQRMNTKKSGRSGRSR